MGKAKDIISPPLTAVVPMKPLAVIDIGSTAVRMTIAQIDRKGKIHELETLQQTTALGKDTFTKGAIQRTSIEECVKTLKKFHRILEEHQIVGEDRVRIVATTAVREASNRDAFVDRVYIANGMKVEVLDEVDVARLTYLSVRSRMSTSPLLSASDILVAEMSGGSTEMLLFREGNLVFSMTYRLGALRLREMFETIRAPLPRHRELMETDIQRTIAQFCQNLRSRENIALLAIGGDCRFAASRLLPDWNHVDFVALPVEALAKFSEEILSLSIDQIVHQYHLSFSDAETLGPTLLFYQRLAQALQLKHVVVSDISMRHGILAEMALRGNWSQVFLKQIIRSAIDIGRKFRFDEKHALHVAHLSSVLFHALRAEHRLEPWYEHLLKVAALLHDIGLYISMRSHHKHSMYLIQNSELFGLSRHDIRLIALVVRYHRRSLPKPVHEEYVSLDRDDRLIVAKLAAILRVADALDRSNNQRIQNIQCHRENDNFVILVPNIEDFTLEELALQRKGTMFEDAFGMNIRIRKWLEPQE